MKHVKMLFSITLLIVAISMICKGTYHFGAFAAEVQASASFFAKFQDTNGDPICNAYIRVGDWSTVTSADGIIYLDKLAAGSHDIVSDVYGIRVQISPIEIKAGEKYVERVYIWDWNTTKFEKALEKMK